MLSRFLSALLLSIVVLSTNASAAPVFDRYVGTLRHERLNKEQLAKLDFIVDREENNVLSLMAVLTVHFGDFKSGEYVAYHYDNVRYNVLTGTLVFAQPDQDLTLTVSRFLDDEFVAQVRSAIGGNVGTLSLRRNVEAKPTSPLIEPIWGEYQGACHPGGTYLQLKTTRSLSDIMGAGNPFAAYEVQGRLGYAEPELLGPVPLVKAIYTESSYDFFRQKLTLFGTSGTPKTYECVTDPEGLTCNGCRLKRISKETTGPRTFFPPTGKNALVSPETPPVVGPIEGLSGEYQGYVHHEYLDLYQAGSLNVVAFQPGTGGLKMSTVARLHFGDHDSIESLAYQFDEKTFPLNTRQFVFKRPTSDVDAVLQITSIGNGIVKGVWYSQLFGKVGGFEFRKTGLPSLPTGAKRMEALSGSYESQTWDLNLRVGLKKTPINTENPFFPRTFLGYLELKSPSPRRAITNGSYDFYTGKIAFHLGDGGPIIVGFRESRQKMFLKPLWATYSAILPEHELERFREVPQ